MLKRTILMIAAWTLAVAATSEATAQGFLKADGKLIVNEKGEKVILRGMGLGGWMLQEGYMFKLANLGQQYKIKAKIQEVVGEEKTKQFYESWLTNHTTKADIDSMARWGFNSMRLPMHYNLYTLPVDEEKTPGQQTWLEKGFAMTDSLLAWCKANGIYLILDLHAAPGGQGNDLNIADRDPSKPSLWDSEANRQKTIAFWKKIADRYVGEEMIAAYDIINEPNWGFEDATNDKNGLKESKNAPLKKLMMDITKAIREVDKDHIVIIEGNGWGNNYKGILEDGLWDKNMVLSFHKYWNYNDQKSIQHIIDYRDKLNVPVWLGETGENSNVWFTQAIALLESNNIGWAWWPLKKLGYNNPLQVKSNPVYDSLVAFWNGKKAEPPNAEDAYPALINLAKASNISQNIYHRDVVDAMIRQPHSNSAVPFTPNVIGDTTTIDAVHFDLGKQGVAYYDKDTANYRVSGKPGAGNKGGVYRNDGVDIYQDSDGAYYIGSIEDGEWLSYTVDVQEPGKYEISFLVSGGRGKISMLVNKRVSGKDISISSGIQGRRWKEVKGKTIKIPKGQCHLKIMANKGGFEWKSFTFRKQ
ncbi:MAG: carbohydrate-binding protein [Chitinophagaceae bacterium]|nr:MAG: carbohydrate-binding protein [Chitinophagaceae bacterium]